MRARRSIVFVTTIAGCLVAPLSATALTAQAASVSVSVSPNSNSEEPGEETENEAGDETTEANITVTPDGRVEYATDLDELGVETEREVIEGTPGPAGQCTMSGDDHGTKATANLTIVREEIEFNPATCEAVYLVAELSAPEAAEYLADVDAPSAAVVNHTSTALAATTYSRNLRTWWEDPINIDISSQRVALRWNQNTWLNRKVDLDSFKGCISGVCLDETYVVNKSIRFGSYSDRQTYAGVAHFRNTSFAKWVAFVSGGPAGWAACGFPTNFTANFHHDGEVIGYDNGGWKVKWSDSKNGACTNLVHHEDSNSSTY